MDLMRAVMNGNADEVQTLLQQGVDINFRTEIGTSVLHCAAYNGCLHILEMLLAAGANVDIQSKRGTTALLVAIERGYVDVVNLLIEAQCDVKRTTSVNCKCPVYCVSGLHLAAQNGVAAIARALIETGSDVNMEMQIGLVSGITPLHIAAERGDLEIVKLLIQGGCILDHQKAKYSSAFKDLDTPNGENCTHHKENASKFQKNKRRFTNFNAPVRKRRARLQKQRKLAYSHELPSLEESSFEAYCLRPSESLGGLSERMQKGATALITAAACGHGEVAKELLAAGADANIGATFKGYSNVTALHLASRFGHLKVAAALLRNETTIINVGMTYHDRNMNTPLHLAASYGHLDIVKALIHTGADIDLQNSCGYTALHWASQAGNDDIVNFLLCKNCDVTKLAALGKHSRVTALHLAAQNGHCRVVEMLVSNGSAIDAGKRCSDILNITSLHLAAYRGHLETVGTLIKLGANIGSRDSLGYTPLNRALQQGHLEIVLGLREFGASSEKVAKQRKARRKIVRQNRLQYHSVSFDHVLESSEI